MTTTIQVHENTLNFLKIEKKRLKASSYDDVIRHWAEKRRPAIDKLFGVDRGKLEPFSEDDHLDLHEDL